MLNKKWINTPAQYRACLIPVFVCCLLLTSCSTVQTLFIEPTVGEPKIYSGTREDLRIRKEQKQSSAAGMALLDLPFSFILDTALLPITAPWALIDTLMHENGETDSNLQQ